MESEELTKRVIAEGSDGFRDGEGTYLTSRRFRGVWLSDVPVDDDGAKGNQVLEIEIPEERIKRWEWIEEGKSYREFLIPAKLVNRYGPPRIIDEDEEERLIREGFQ